MHGVGLRRKEDAVCLYVDDKASDADVQGLVGEVQREISPHHVIVVRDEPAFTTYT